MLGLRDAHTIDSASRLYSVLMDRHDICAAVKVRQRCMDPVIATDPKTLNASMRSVRDKAVRIWDRSRTVSTHENGPLARPVSFSLPAAGSGWSEWRAYFSLASARSASALSVFSHENAVNLLPSAAFTS